MESNDRLNLQNDKEIEKLIPFDIGTAPFWLFRAYFVLWEDLQNQQVVLEARASPYSDSDLYLRIQKEM